ncbi:MAG: single-stranded DNA-binding protein [Candidatus Colwellbacteria bacterium]|jgi:single-strand DNA-binding protein|nr:single-stranded DNA-binding protein [Candidatus Colwellbacteria bacterium]MCK9497481.1 single-stranded DNA-binding protein [Candidatus Colwellbacteria bacterium]MDD3752473.1 single-stranded DNA-binding protein [Candidatus Colwellbacteria bacterium]MDD4818737.1 single-stranded DNA-binding protein [Candidatus Colwellbacteria bacterium]
MNLNKVFIMGRLTADPEVRTTSMGDSVTTLGVATNRVWNDKSGQKKESAEFHSVVLWGRQADIAGQFLVKGSIVFIEGRLQTRTWQAKDGSNRRVTEIVAERMQLGPRPMNAQRKTADDRESYSGGRNDESDSSSDEVPVIEMEDDDKEEIKPEDLPF